MRVIKNIIGSIFVSIAVLIFWVFILPGYDTQSYLESSVEIRFSVLASKQQLIQKVAELNQEYQDKFNELKRLALVVPVEKNVAEVITSIEAISVQSGSRLNELTISDPPSIGEISDYGNLYMEIILVGSYESAASFFNHLERYIRLIDPTGFSMTIKEDETTPEQVVLITNIKANLYFLKSADEQKTIRSQVNGVEE